VGLDKKGACVDVLGLTSLNKSLGKNLAKKKQVA